MEKERRRLDSIVGDLCDICLMIAEFPNFFLINQIQF